MARVVVCSVHGGWKCGESGRREHVRVNRVPPGVRVVCVKSTIVCLIEVALAALGTDEDGEAVYIRMHVRAEGQ